MFNTGTRLNKACNNMKFWAALVDPVEDGVAGVQADGGEDGLPGGGGGGGGSVGGGGEGADVGGLPLGPGDHAEAEVVGNVGDGVGAGLVHEGVCAGDALAEGCALLLVGGVDVLVAEGRVAGLVLRAVLAAGDGGRQGGGGHGDRGSGVGGGDRGGNGDGGGGVGGDRGSVVATEGRAVVGAGAGVGARVGAGVEAGVRVLGRGGGQGG